MTFDFINSALVVLSCLFVIPTLVCTYRHKKVVGVHWITPLFFTVYGFWNIAYFWYLGQMFSVGASGAMLVCNIAWLIMVLKYSRD